MCVAFIYGTMYYRQGFLPSPYASMGNIQNIIGIIFSSTNFLGMTNLLAVMPLVGECDEWTLLACCSNGDTQPSRWLIRLLYSA